MTDVPPFGLLAPRKIVKVGPLCPRCPARRAPRFPKAERPPDPRCNSDERLGVAPGRLQHLKPSEHVSFESPHGSRNGSPAARAFT